jgi:tetratricopeptide (TPR) repeat protein
MVEEVAKLEKLLQKAKELYQQGDLEASANCFQQLLAAKETRSEAYYGLGLIEFNQKKYAEALDFLTTATQVNSRNANAHYYIGAIHEEQGNLEEARNAYLNTLSSNPNHRGAKEGITRIGSKVADITLLSVNSMLYPRSEFYELLSNDKSLAAQKALALIDELEFAVRPTVISHLGRILYGALPVSGAVLIFSWFLFIFLCIVFSEIGDPQTATESAISILARVVPLLITAGISVSIVLGYRSARNTKYEFSKGFLKITKGVVVISTKTVEMYRVREVNVTQDWFSQINGDATLVLTIDNSKQIALPGIAELRRAYYLQDRLRELIVLLRSLPWIKGIIL